MSIGGGSNPLDAGFAPRLDQLTVLREGLRHRLDEFGVDEDASAGIVLVFDEIVSNAIEHGEIYRTPGTLLRVCLHRTGGDVLLDFVDPDTPPDIVAKIEAALSASRGAMPSLDSERGRGLFLITHNVAGLDVTVRPEGGMRMRARFEAGAA